MKFFLKIGRLYAASLFSARTVQRQGPGCEVDTVRHKNIFFQPQARIHAHVTSQVGPFFHHDARTQVRVFSQMDMIPQTAGCLQACLLYTSDAADE